MMILIFALLNICRSVVKASIVPTALSIPPSEYWDGNDGRWSTFFVQVGTPPQVLRLLPSTSASAGTTLWVVLPEGCSMLNANDSACPSERGENFLRNSSTSWSPKSSVTSGLFQLIAPEEEYLGLTGNAYYGFDAVTLGIGGSGLPTLSHQTVAGIATNDFWLGSLGLSPIPFNFSNFNDPQPSLLVNLRNQSFIPSSSWAYTAGAFYKDIPAFGSLTLGGYDSTKFAPNNVSTAFGPDFSRDLLIEIQGITYETAGSSSKLTKETGIYAFVDSLVTHLWLPLGVCEAFESAFDLTWNDTLGLYLLDDATHADLNAKNPSFKFTLGSASDAGTVEIVLPYSAFDLNITVNDIEQRYFPLKRAQNSSQYTLGRVFLQEAYIIADYDRQNFSISQALFPGTSTPEDIVAIVLLGYSNPGYPDQPGQAKSSGLKTGPKVAIAVCGFALLLAAIAMLYYCWRRMRHRSVKAWRDSTSIKAAGTRPETPEKLADSAVVGQQITYELDTSNPHIPEADAESRLPAELAVGGGYQEWHELPADHSGT